VNSEQKMRERKDLDMKALIHGCGAWGTTIAQLLADKVKEVFIVCHDTKICDEINAKHTNTLYLPAIPLLKSNIQALLSSEAEEVSPKYHIVVTASQYYRNTLEKINNKLVPEQIILSATKGMETGSNKSVLEIAYEVLPPAFMATNFALLSGPNLANEIFAGKPAATVIAANDPATANKFQALISSPQFRAYTSDDVIGVEYGGILKNIIAIAAGMLDSMDLGANAKSALLVRGIAEIKRFAVAQGAREATVYGLSGFGDLITTCMGPKSRNYSLGFRIGKGEKVQDVIASMTGVAEGVNACLAVKSLADSKNIAMPITQNLYQVLFENASLEKSITRLMNRDLKRED